MKEPHKCGKPSNQFKKSRDMFEHIDPTSTSAPKSSPNDYLAFILNVMFVFLSLKDMIFCLTIYVISPRGVLVIFVWIRAFLSCQIAYTAAPNKSLLTMLKMVSFFAPRLYTCYNIVPYFRNVIHINYRIVLISYCHRKWTSEEKVFMIFLLTLA
jgi:hypothetical protein